MASLTIRREEGDRLLGEHPTGSIVRRLGVKIPTCWLGGTPAAMDGRPGGDAPLGPVPCSGGYQRPSAACHQPSAMG